MYVVIHILHNYVYMYIICAYAPIRCTLLYTTSLANTTHTLHLHCSVVLERPYFKYWQLLAELANVTLDDVLRHATEHLFADTSLLCLLHGNLNASQVHIHFHTATHTYTVKAELLSLSYRESVVL